MLNRRRSQRYLKTLALAASPFLINTSIANEGVDYAAIDNWLCRPDHLNACEVNIDTTVVAADGTLTHEAFVPHPAPEIDCFYVYPTVSTDSTPNSDMTADAAEMNVIRSQFARFGAQCRQFAPMYRQVTLTALRAGITGADMQPDREMPYRDVVNAWHYYLENHNAGRGVVLIGHSQGAGVLSRLIANEIEGSEQQALVVSALIIGTNVQVGAGELMGGSFQSMPLCQSADESGCVVAYVSYRDNVPPPPGASFGRSAAQTEAACVSPPALLGRGEALHAYLSNQQAEGFSANAPEPWTSTGESIETPFISVPGLLSGHCVHRDGFHYLEVTVNADPNDRRSNSITGDVRNPDGSINAAWGLHLIDMNLVMGDLVALIERQGQHYLAQRNAD